MDDESALDAGVRVTWAEQRRQVLRLADLRARVRLGCDAAERQQPQEVSIDVAVELSRPPAACRTDRLEDTLCGARLAESLVRVCESGQYALIEHLAEQLHAAARALAPGAAAISLELNKLHPPIDRLHGGMSFRIEVRGTAA